jgi:triacylglycerol lipase
MPSFSTSTAWALCSYVDAGGTPPKDWTAVWTPQLADSNSNYGVVLQHTDGTYALVIQGTKNKLGAQEDFAVTEQVPFPPIAGAQIAIGTETGMDVVLQQLENSSGTSLQAFLNGLAAGSQLLISGHSLGGNLASAFAPWIAANFAAFGGTSVQPVMPVTQLPASIQVITFAAPTAGNGAFAAFLNSQLNYQAYFNTNDVVPHVWGVEGTLSAKNIQNMFSSPGPTCPDAVKDLVAKILTEIKLNGLVYTQTNGTYFTGAIRHEPEGDAAWMAELEYQHNHAYSAQYGKLV